MDKTIVKKVPETPGIYIFKAGKTPIYVGKAINLKRRILSYFDLNLELKTSRMVGEADSLSFIKVASELEALLLEAKLINSYQPKYNSISKDDKHPLYIRITNEEFPRVLTARKIAKSEPNIAFFGPFPNSKNVYSVLRMVRRIFPYSDHPTGKRGCLFSHIGLCNPCPSEIIKLRGKSEFKKLRQLYLKNIRSIKSILSGKINTLQKNQYRQMEEVSKNLMFEDAAKIRDQIKKIEYITQPSIPINFYLKNPNLYEDLRQKELSALKKLIEKEFPKIKTLKRVECFDIAHLAGVSPTASMVTFIDGEAEKSEYRHFKVRQNKSQSDYDSMKEIAQRRLKQSWDKPDLIVVDGGVGQVNTFRKVITNIPVVGIAKNPDRLIISKEHKIKLEKEALALVQRMRDEAHRFARRYHHHLITVTNFGKIEH